MNAELRLFRRRLEILRIPQHAGHIGQRIAHPEAVCRRQHAVIAVWQSNDIRVLEVRAVVQRDRARRDVLQMLGEALRIRGVVLAELFEPPIGGGFEGAEPAKLEKLGYRQILRERDTHAFEGFEIRDKVSILVDHHAL